MNKSWLRMMRLPFIILHSSFIICLAGCQEAPLVRVEQRSTDLSRAAVRQAKVAVGAIVADAGSLPPGLEPVVLQTLRDYFRAGVEPPSAVAALESAKAALAPAAEQFRARNAVDSAAMAPIGRQAKQQLGADYLILVKLSQLSGYFDPAAGHSRMDREGLGASATARIALIDCQTGQPVFVAVGVAHREAGSYAREAAPPPVSYSEIRRTSETSRQAVYSEDATPAAALDAAVSAVLQQL